MQYAVIFAQTKDEFEQKVQRHLGWGWVCQGGVCVVSGRGYYQAMTLTKE